MHALLDAFQQWAGHQLSPAHRHSRLARGTELSASLCCSRNIFNSQGFECIITDPREVEYRDGRLMAGDFHITLIYKRVLISELIERGGLDHPVVRAVLDGAVCMVNPFRCKILHKKASLAVL